MNDGVAIPLRRTFLNVRRSSAHSLVVLTTFRPFSVRHLSSASLGLRWGSRTGMSSSGSSSSSSSTDDDPEVAADVAAPAIELLQLSSSELEHAFTSGTVPGIAILPSGRSIDVAEFISKSFSTLRKDISAQATSISVFFQFMAMTTAMFDAVKYPDLNNIVQPLHSQHSVNVDLVEVVITYVRSLDMSTQRNHTIDALTNILNLFSIIINYIKYELTLAATERHLCLALASSDNLVPFVNETVHLIRVRINSVITVEMRDSFRSRLVLFWIALIDNRVLPSSQIEAVVLTFIRHEDVCMVVGHLLSQVEQDHQASLHVFQTLVNAEFIAFIRKDSWRGLREKFLSLAFTKMQGLINRDVLDLTAEPSLEVMSILIEVLGDPPFVSLLMVSRVHQDMLLVFFKALVQRSPMLFAPTTVPNILIGDDEKRSDDLVPATLHCHSRLLNRLSLSLLLIYSRLALSEKDGFVQALVDAHDTETSRSALMQHLKMFSALPVFLGRHPNAKSNRSSLTLLVNRVMAYSSRSPPHSKSESESKNTECVPETVGPPANGLPSKGIGGSRGSTNKRKHSDLEQYLIDTDFRLTARNVKCLQDGSWPTSQHGLQTLSERFVGGLGNVVPARVAAIPATAAGVPVAASSSKASGWGLAAARDVGRDEMLIEVTGRIVSLSDLGKYDSPKITAVEEAASACIVKYGSDCVLDSSVVGSLSRCIAHSCDPSAFLQRWLVDGVERLFVFSSRSIPLGQSITLDYEAAGIVSRPFQCHCGSSECTRRRIEVAELPWPAPVATASVAPKSDAKGDDSFDTALHALATAGSMLQAESDGRDSSASGRLKRRYVEMEPCSAPAEDAHSPPRDEPATASGPIYRGSAAALVRKAQLVANKHRNVARGPGPPPGYTYAPPAVKSSPRPAATIDALLAFIRARGLASRNCAHIAIARGIQMHRRAVGAEGNSSSAASPSLLLPQQTPSAKHQVASAAMRSQHQRHQNHLFEEQQQAQFQNELRLQMYQQQMNYAASRMPSSGSVAKATSGSRSTTVATSVDKVTPSMPVQPQHQGSSHMAILNQSRGPPNQAQTVMAQQQMAVPSHQILPSQHMNIPPQQMMQSNSSSSQKFMPSFYPMPVNMPQQQEQQQFRQTSQMYSKLQQMRPLATGGYHPQLSSTGQRPMQHIVPQAVHSNMQFQHHPMHMQPHQQLQQQALQPQHQSIINQNASFAQVHQVFTDPSQNQQATRTSPSLQRQLAPASASSETKNGYRQQQQHHQQLQQQQQHLQQQQQQSPPQLQQQPAQDMQQGDFIQQPKAAMAMALQMQQRGGPSNSQSQQQPHHQKRLQPHSMGSMQPPMSQQQLLSQPNMVLGSNGVHSMPFHPSMQHPYYNVRPIFNNQQQHQMQQRYEVDDPSQIHPSSMMMHHMQSRNFVPQSVESRSGATTPSTMSPMHPVLVDDYSGQTSSMGPMMYSSMQPPLVWTPQMILPGQQMYPNRMQPQQPLQPHIPIRVSHETSQVPAEVLPEIASVSDTKSTPPAVS